MLLALVAGWIIVLVASCRPYSLITSCDVPIEKIGTNTEFKLSFTVMVHMVRANKSLLLLYSGNNTPKLG